MEDKQIVQLFWDRNEQAIEESSKKYGNYCRRIARNILQSEEDVKECVNGTWLNAWNAIPPHRWDDWGRFWASQNRPQSSHHIPDCLIRDTFLFITFLP